MVEVLERAPCLCRRRWNPAGRRWSPRGTCWSSRGSCWCRTRARTAGTGTPPRWRCGRRCRTPPCSDRAACAALRRCARTPPPRRSARSGRSPRRRASDVPGGRRLRARSRSSSTARKRCARRRNRGRRACALPPRLPPWRRSRRTRTKRRARIGPGAAGAIEAFRLIHAAKRTRLAVERHLRTQSARHGLQCTPPAGGTAVGANARNFLEFTHRSRPVLIAYES